MTNQPADTQQRRREHMAAMASCAHNWGPPVTLSNGKTYRVCTGCGYIVPG